MDRMALKRLELLKSIANSWAGGGANFLKDTAVEGYDAIKKLMTQTPVRNQDGELTDEIIKQSFNTAANVGLGSSVVPAPKNAVRMFGGVHAKEAPLDELHLAEKLLKEKAPMEEIISQTGWGFGKEGKPRFEIFGGDKSKINMLDEPLNYNKPFKLGDLWDFPELYKNYPDMKNIAIHGGPGPGNAVYHRGEGKWNPPRIGINTGDIQKNLAYPASDGLRAFDMKKKLGHEGQHHIQTVEGFTPGFNPDMLTLSPDLMNIYKDDILKLSEDYMKVYKKSPSFAANEERFREAALFNALREKGKDVYLRSAGEQEAIKVSDRMGHSDPMRLAYPWNLPTRGVNQRIPYDQQHTHNIYELAENIPKNFSTQDILKLLMSK